MKKVLVVDDKELMRDSVGTMLTRSGWQVLVASNGKTAVRIAAERRPDVILTDLQMPEMDGLELLREIRQVDEQLPVVLMTAYATIETAVEAMKLGAYDYITKPFDGNVLVATIKRAMEHAELIRENAVLKRQSGKKQNRKKRNRPDLIGKTPAIQMLLQQVEQIASSNATVLVTGESGVGKEVVAQTIHALGPRHRAPFLAVNCAALSASLLESELFGHERGAFTGADKLRKGRFELAHEGTLLLDEISEVPPAVQAKLLRVIQERCFERVGSSVTQQADVRIIATTNRDLSIEVAAGRFRQDLYFRLHVLPIRVPPLRERVDDIGCLSAHLLKLVAAREGTEPKVFDSAAIQLMKQYSWPGNVRELANICERAALFCTGECISSDIIQPWLTSRPAIPATFPMIQPAVPVSAETGVPRFGGVGYASGSIASGSVATYPNLTVGSSASVEPSALPFAVGGGGGGHLVDLHGVDPAGAENPNTMTPLDSGKLYDSASSDVAGDDSSLCGVDCAASDRVTIKVGQSLEDIEREVILATLDRNSGHRQRTASALGIGVRTLGLKLRKWKDLELIAGDT